MLTQVNNARPTIKNDALVTHDDFNADGIATILLIVGSWGGHAATNAPKFYSHISWCDSLQRAAFFLVRGSNGWASCIYHGAQSCTVSLLSSLVSPVKGLEALGVFI